MRFDLEKVEGAFRYWFFAKIKIYPVANREENVRVPKFRDIFERLTERQREVVAAYPRRFRRLYNRL